MFDYLIADIYYPWPWYDQGVQVVTRGPAGVAMWRQTNITQIHISAGNEHCTPVPRLFGHK